MLAVACPLMAHRLRILVPTRPGERRRRDVTLFRVVLHHRERFHRLTRARHRAGGRSVRDRKDSGSSLLWVGFPLCLPDERGLATYDKAVLSRPIVFLLERCHTAESCVALWVKHLEISLPVHEPHDVVWECVRWPCAQVNNLLLFPVPYTFICLLQNS